MQLKKMVVALAATALLVPVAACSSSTPKDGGDQPTLHVALPTHAWTNAIKESIPEFEKVSGIKVDLTTFGEDQLSDQYNVKLNTKSKDFDVMMFRPPQDGKLFVQNEWLAPIDDYLKQADAAYKWDDFLPATRDSVTVDGSIYGAPLITEQEVLYYNKKLLASAGVNVPTTMDELEAAAAKLTDKGKGQYGFLSRGQLSASVTQFSSFLYSFGGDFDNGKKATLNTPEAKKAYEFYGRMLNQYAPTGTTEMNWIQAMPIFAQGKVAFYTDVSSLSPNLDDPATSTVVDDWGVAPFPAGPAGSHPYNISAWALGINAFSEHKDLAWKFMEWATGQDMSLKLQQKGQSLARASLYASAEGTKGFRDDMIAAIKSSTAAGVAVGHDRPLVIKVSEAREIIGKPIVTGIDGGDVAAAIEEAQTLYQKFLDSETKA
ncbi:MAG: sugar ABC transporter substrate-binding protein [Propionibacteriaceae bacterium]|jgi:multiple sugar transport system substrate-binding protein|nr:sugar ABC transporter substrate-binding protein [Propionibacteriaceae bacterium]